MARYLFKRLLELLPTLLLITLLSFALMRLAGSDAVLQKMENTGTVLSAEELAHARAALGLDQPFFVQYGRWLFDLLHGDLGTSYVSGKEVFTTLWDKLPATLTLAGGSLGMTILLSGPLGIVAAVYQNRLPDRIIRFFTFLGNSLPNFFVALLLLLLFAIKLRLFPVITIERNAQSVFLPSLTLCIAMSSKYTRQVRTVVLEELGKEYVLAATARGVRFSTTLCKSVLRAVLVQLFTLMTLSAGSLLGGTAIVESIFLWDGMGKLAADAIQMRDIPIVQAYVLWMAILYVLLHLAADLCYGLLDPRIRLGGKTA